VVCDLFSGTGVVAARLAQRYDVLTTDIQEYARVLASALLEPRPLPRAEVDRLLVEANIQVRAMGPCIQTLAEAENAAITQTISGDPRVLCDIVESGSIMGFRLEPDAVPLALRSLLAVTSDAMGDGADTTLTRYYGGVYFSYVQAMELDALATTIRRLKPRYLDTATAALISTASEIVSTVGNQFAQPVRPRGLDGRIKPHAAKAVVRGRTASVFEAFSAWLGRYCLLPQLPGLARVLRADYRDVLQDLPRDVVAVYADPPYTRDHYSRYYHVLETIAIGDEPHLSVVNLGGISQPSRGLYRVDRHQSPFCIKSQAPGAFATLFDAVARRGVPLVLSYSPYEKDTGARPRLLTVEQITALAAESFSSVDLISAGRVSHSKFNADRVNVDIRHDAEVLVLCRP